MRFELASLKLALQPLPLAAATLLALAASPALAEPASGDACTTAGVTTLSAGPEDAGEGYRLVCDGTVWKSVLEFVEVDGRVRLNIGNDQTACGTEKAGRLRYDDADDLWEYCSGVAWKPLLETLPAPVVWLKLDETTGASASNSGTSGNAATLVNTEVADWVAGKNGNALAFDGTNEYLTLTPGDMVYGGAPRTVAFWLRPNNITTRMDLFHYGNETAGNNWKILASHLSSGTITTSTWGGTYGTAAVLTAGAWNHIAVVLPSGGTNAAHIIYINGVATATALTSGSNLSVNTTSSGQARVSQSTNAANGLLDDLRFYNVALTANQVLALYNSYP
jgi:hypothetical protein